MAAATGTADILIVGSGIVGLTIARELVAHGASNVVLLEKEDELGKHASGRNSGVLHAGIYYAPDSVKARTCLNGNFLMKAYCKERGLPVLEAGKVIVARTEEEIPTLEELQRRATANGAKVEFVDEQQLAEIEPNARTTGKALFSHYTAAVDPKLVLQSLRALPLPSRSARRLCSTSFGSTAAV
jgi:L-2-hydroxyglutarate oxidase